MSNFSKNKNYIFSTEELLPLSHGEATCPVTMADHLGSLVPWRNVKSNFVCIKRNIVFFR
jgi:hypothetical protein